MYVYTDTRTIIYIEESIPLHNKVSKRVALSYDVLTRHHGKHTNVLIDISSLHGDAAVGSIR